MILPIVKYGALLWFGTVAGFLACSKAKDLYLAGTLSKRLYRSMLPVFVLFVFADAAFNAVYGSIIFRELPQWQEREWLFTARVKRHFRNIDGGSTPAQVRAAKGWARDLNSVDPGHVR